MRFSIYESSVFCILEKFMPSCRSPSGSRGRAIKSYNSRGRPSALETNGHVKLEPIDSSSQSESTSQVSFI